MGQTIREIMTPDPVQLGADTTLKEAARVMRDRDIGNVLVIESDSKLCGIVTDRDIVVRALADGKDPANTPLREICSASLTQLAPSDDVDNAVQAMAKKGIRRIPVVEGQRAVGVVSLGDLAIARDRQSALASISAHSPNH